MIITEFPLHEYTDQMMYRFKICSLAILLLAIQTQSARAADPDEQFRFAVETIIRMNMEAETPEPAGLEIVGGNAKTAPEAITQPPEQSASRPGPEITPITQPPRLVKQKDGPIKVAMPAENKPSDQTPAYPMQSAPSEDDPADMLGYPLDNPVEQPAPTQDGNGVSASGMGNLTGGGAAANPSRSNIRTITPADE